MSQRVIEATEEPHIMNKEEEKLYKEWKEVENRLEGTVIQYTDIELAQKLRPEVWNKLKDKLNVTDKFTLGSRLEKPLKEIFDKKYPPGRLASG